MGRSADVGNSTSFIGPNPADDGEHAPCGVMLDRTAMALTVALEALRELVPNHHPARVQARKALDAWVEWSAHSGSGDGS